MHERRIPVKDVKQITLEATNRVLELSFINNVNLKLGKTKKPTNVYVQEKMDGWIDGRIQMVLDRLDNKKSS